MSQKIICGKAEIKKYIPKQIYRWKQIKIFSNIALLTIFIIVTIVFKVNLIAAIILTLSVLLALLADTAATKEARFKKGESGELIVKKELESIPNIYSYRDVILDEENPWDIDFVIVSKSGLFVLEVKSYEGRITADNDVWSQFIMGKRKNIGSFSKQARGNAFQLHEFIKKKDPDFSIPYITPVVVLTNPYNQKDIRNDKNKTLVTSPSDIKYCIESQGEKLEESCLRGIVTILDKIR